MALDIVEEMLGAGSILSLDIFHSLLDACQGSYEYNLVYDLFLVFFFQLVTIIFMFDAKFLQGFYTFQ